MKLRRIKKYKTIKNNFFFLTFKKMTFFLIRKKIKIILAIDAKKSATKILSQVIKV